MKLHPLIGIEDGITGSLCACDLWTVYEFRMVFDPFEILGCCVLWFALAPEVGLHDDRDIVGAAAVLYEFPVERGILNILHFGDTAHDSCVADAGIGFQSN